MMNSTRTIWVPASAVMSVQDKGCGVAIVGVIRNRGHWTLEDMYCLLRTKVGGPVYGWRRTTNVCHSFNNG